MLAMMYSMNKAVPNIITSITLFLLLGTYSSYLYPGGHWWDTQYPHYHFWLNFFCDALKNTAYNDQPNHLGANIASIAMFIFLLVCFFLPGPLWHKKYVIKTKSSGFSI